MRDLYHFQTIHQCVKEYHLLRKWSIVADTTRGTSSWINFQAHYSIRIKSQFEAQLALEKTRVCDSV